MHVVCIIQIIGKALEGVSLESGSDLHKMLRVTTYHSLSSAIQRLESMLPVFRSRMGAMLFLISALLSRGLVCWSVKEAIFFLPIFCYF